MSLSLFAGKQQQKRTRAAIARAARLESLETRTLLSTWYVANGGSDSAAGSITSPMATIQAALNKAAAGDSVTVRGGTYNISSEIDINKDNITLTGYAGETAKIIAPTTNSGVQVAIRVGMDADHVTISNLDISGGYYYTIKAESNWYDNNTINYPNQHGPQYLRLDRLKLHDSGQDVIKLTPGTNYSIIENSEIYNSGRRYADNAEGIDAVQANHSIVRNNYIHDTTTNGIYYKGGDVGTIIENNRLDRIAYSGILAGQDTDPEWFDAIVNPNFYESINCIIRNNIVTNAQGAGIGTWGGNGTQILNNTIVSSATTMFGGILIQAGGDASGNTPSNNITVMNNIVSVNGSRAAIEIRSNGLTGYLKSDYNLFYDTNSAASFSNAVGAGSGGLSTWQAAGYDTHSREANPNLDSSNHLTSSSPAIDKGTTLSNVINDYDWQARPAGAAYDIGADEYGGTGTIDPTPPPTPTPDPTPTYTPQWRNTAFGSQNAKFNLEFDATAKMADQDVVMGASNGAADSVTDMGLIVRFNSSGSIDVRKGSGYAADAKVAYAAGTKYHFKLVGDMATHTYDVYVTPAGGATTRIASGYAFRTEQASATSFNNLGEYNETGDADVSSLAVATVTTTVAGWANTAIATQSGQFTVEVDAKPGQNSLSVMAGLSNGAADAVSDLVAAIRFNSAGYIDVRSGSYWSKSTKVKYQPNTTYHLKFVVNMSTKKYDAYITAPGGSAVKVGSGYSFNSAQSTASSVNNFVGMTAYGGTLATSNLLVQSNVTVTPTPSLTADLAKGKTTSASFVQGSGYEANKATDGLSTTRWATGDQVSTAWIQVDLGATYNLGTVKLNWEYASAKSYQIQVSNDGVNWTTAYATTTSTGGQQTISGLTASGRFVRINCTQANNIWGYSLWSFQVYGR